MKTKKPRGKQPLKTAFRSDGTAEPSNEKSQFNIAREASLLRMRRPQVYTLADAKEWLDEAIADCIEGKLTVGYSIYKNPDRLPVELLFEQSGGDYVFHWCGAEFRVDKEAWLYAHDEARKQGIRTSTI